MAVALASAAGNQEHINGSGGDIVLPAPTSIASGDFRGHLLWEVIITSNIPAVGTGMTDLGSAYSAADSNGVRAVGKVAGGSEGSITHTTPGTESASTGYAWRATGALQPTTITLATSAAADDIIDTATAHGFVVGQAVVFPTLTGGTGLSANTIYYVIAANLGAQTFQVATTRGGSAVNFSSNITAGTVQASPVVASAVGHIATGASPRTLPTIETPVDNCLIVYLAIRTEATAVPAISGVTQHDTFWNAGAGDIAVLAYETKATAGTTTARTVTWTGGVSSGVAYAIIALQPAPTAPSAPAQPTVQAGPESVLVEWVAPANGGSAITGYKIERNINSAGWTQITASTGNTKVWYLDQGRTNGTPIQYRISAVNAVGTSSASTASASATPQHAPLPEQVDATGRWIEDQTGAFWPLLGDAGGLWPHTASDAVVLDYLDELATRGYTLWRVKNVESGESGATRPLYTDVVTGTDPFATGPYAGAINTAYWDRQEWFVAQALVRGITMLASPLWLGVTDDEGCREEITALTDANLEDRGEEIGARFAQYPNIIWAFGGDLNATSTVLSRLGAFVDGVQTSLTSASRSHLMTIHGAPDTISVDQGGWSGLTTGWRINGVYDYGHTVEEYLAAWADNAGPVFQLEGAYRHEHSVTLAQLRHQSWWGILAGAGAVPGNNPRFHLGLFPGTFPGDGSLGTLAETWDDPDGDQDRDTADFALAIDLVKSWTWLGDTALDTTGAFLTAGAASTTTGALARYGGGYAVIYMPTTRAVTLDLTGYGSATITRIDPVSGSESVLTTSATGTGYVVASQGNNSSGDSDWVLVVEAGGTDGTATPTAITVAAATPTPTASGNSNTSPAAVARTASLPTPTTSGAGTTTPTAITPSASLPAPTTSGASSTSPAATALTGSLPAPTASGESGGTATPTATETTATLSAPTVGGSSNTTPAAMARTASLPAPTSTGGSNTTPAAIARTASLPAPTGSGDANTTPAAITPTASLPAPTASGSGGGTALPAAIELLASLAAATGSGSSGTSPTAIQLLVTMPAPTGTGDSQTTPTPILLAVALPAPVGSGAGIVTPAAIVLAVVMGGTIHVIIERPDGFTVALAAIPTATVTLTSIPAAALALDPIPQGAVAWQQ